MSEPSRPFESTGTRMAKCSDCGEKHEVTQDSWDLAMTFHTELIRRGEEGLPGVGRCKPCAQAWRASEKEKDQQEYFRDAELFRRMRIGLVKADRGQADREDIRRFISQLPDDFMSDHHTAVASFRVNADARFTKRDGHNKSDGDDFGG